MPIFVGVRWIGGMRVVSSKIAKFASWGRYIFRNFIYETKIIIYEYVAPQWLFIVIETVTFNSHFALNTVF